MLFPGMEDVGLRPDDPAAATDTATPPPPKGELSDEEVTKKAGGTVSEFMSIRDFQEAEACVRELGCTEGQEALVVSAALQARPRRACCAVRVVAPFGSNTGRGGSAGTHPSRNAMPQEGTHNSGHASAWCLARARSG